MEVVIAKTDKQKEDAFYIRRKVFIEEQNVPPDEEIDEYENESTHFVLYDGTSPVGAGRFRDLNGYGKIERICVLPEYRGKGAGKQIMEFIHEYAQSQHYKKLKLNAQEHAIPFYENIGYSVVSETFLDAGIPHKTMEKSL